MYALCRCFLLPGGHCFLLASRRSGLCVSAQTWSQQLLLVTPFVRTASLCASCSKGLNDMYICISVLNPAAAQRESLQTGSSGKLRRTRQPHREHVLMLESFNNYLPATRSLASAAFAFASHTHATASTCLVNSKASIKPGRGSGRECFHNARSHSPAARLLRTLAGSWWGDTLAAAGGFLLA